VAAPERNDADDDQRTLVHALLGSTQLCSGQLEEAAASLEQARADADRTGHQVLGLAATANLALLEAVRGRLARADELVRLVGALLERLRAATPAGLAGGRPSAPAALLVPLSEREQVVLRYLSSRLSAGERYVSLNTVKTHIKSIYRKLDTNRRWDAVKRARQLQLLYVRRPAAPGRGAGPARAGRRRRTPR
jgi:LuxR family transcriptional regulator, maltose regulon positive regulatory protein